MKGKGLSILAALGFCAALFSICGAAQEAYSGPVIGIFIADAHDGRGQVPFQTDGTTAGTGRVALPYRPSSTFEFHQTAQSITIWSYSPGGNAYNLDFLSESGAVSTWNGCNGCILQNFHEVGSDLYFVATPPGSADVLYKTSGTIGSTVAVCAIAPRCGIVSGVVLSSVFTFQSTVYYSFVDFGGKTSIYSIVNNKFARAFTALNADRSYDDLRWDSQVGDQIIFGNKTNGNGSELWATDGTQSGRRLVKVFYGGQTSGLLSNPSIPTKILFVDGKAVIIAQDPSHGTGLWLTDATGAGTKRLNVSKDDAYLIYQNYGRWSQLFGTKLYFTTSDIDQSRFLGLGRSLYYLDSTKANPTLVKLIYQNHEVVLLPDASFAITPDGWLYTNGIQVNMPTCKIENTGLGPNFVGNGCDEKLYRLNLASKEVQVVANPYVNDKTCTNDCDKIQNITASGNSILFSASDKRFYTANNNRPVDNLQPWFSAGTLASSMKLKNLASYLDGGSQPYQFIAMP